MIYWAVYIVAGLCILYWYLNILYQLRIYKRVCLFMRKDYLKLDIVSISKLLCMFFLLCNDICSELRFHRIYGSIFMVGIYWRAGKDRQRIGIMGGIPRLNKIDWNRYTSCNPRIVYNSVQNFWQYLYVPTYSFYLFFFP